MSGQSRDLNNLNWKVREVCLELIANCAKQYVKLVVFETTRSDDYQAKLYSYGRTDKSKPIVTNMKKPVWHKEGIGLAFDAYVEIDGKAIWNGSHPHWKIVISEAKKLGLTCGADWKMKDTCHFQLDDGLTSKDILAGKRPSWFYEKPKSQPTQSPIEILASKDIINDISYWKSNSAKGKVVEGNSAKALIDNFYYYKSGKRSTMDAIDYLYNRKIITDKEQWKSIVNGGSINGEFIAIVIDRMSKDIK